MFKKLCLLLILAANVCFTYTRVDFIFTLSDGIKLDCTKFIPEGSPPAGGWPCVIICHGFGLTKFYEMPTAEDLADEDYYSLVYTMRGHGNSEGVSNFISTVEANDLKQVVQYVKNDANTNDNKIAVNGGSQGGIIPFLAACTGMQVKTIMPDMSSPEHGSNWIENGCIKMVFIWSAGYTSNIVRYNSTVGRFKTWALSGQKDKWDSLMYYLPQNRDFLNQVSNCQIPFLSQSTWQDKFFNTLGMIRSSFILPYNNIKIYFGTMDGHGSDYDDEEEEYKDQVYSDWLDFHLKGIQNNIMNAGKKFTYACSMFPVNDRNFWTWQRYDSPIWPPAGVQNVRLYIHPDNKLQVYGYGGTQAGVNFLNDVIDTNVTLQYLVNTEFRGPLFDQKFRKSELYFDTPALLADATMAGTPVVYLNYLSSADICQYNMQIWEVRSNGEEKLVTRINYTDRNYIANQNKQTTVNGQSCAHIFKTGSRIRIKLNNLDNVPMYTANGDTTDYFLRTNPFVLPVTKRATNRVYINNALRTYFDLPLKNFIIGIKSISSDIPIEFKLFQNYPNPFNPTTKIRFSIPAALSFGELRVVRLIIYDALGREVETLVNEQLHPGTYEANWSGANYASGIYFYRMATERFSQTNKMILLK